MKSRLAIALLSVLSVSSVPLPSVAQDIATPLRWEVQTERPSLVTWPIVRGETVSLEPTFLRYSAALNLTQVSNVWLRYKPVGATNWHSTNGIVSSATGGVAQCRWTSALELTNSSLQFEIVLASSSSTVCRARGYLTFSADITYQSVTSIPTALVSIDWATVQNTSPASAPFALNGEGTTNLFAGPATTGLITSAAANTNQYLRGDGTWGTPAGGGDMLASIYDPAGSATQVVCEGDARLPAGTNAQARVGVLETNTISPGELSAATNSAAFTNAVRAAQTNDGDGGFGVWAGTHTNDIEIVLDGWPDLTNSASYQSNLVAAIQTGTNNWQTAFLWGNHATNGYLLPASTNAAVIIATGLVAGVGYLLPADTNSAIDDATNRVAGVGYLLSDATNSAAFTNAVRAAQTSGEGGGATDASTNYFRDAVNITNWVAAGITTDSWNEVSSWAGAKTNDIEIVLDGWADLANSASYQSNLVAAIQAGTNNWQTAFLWGNHATNGYLLPASTNDAVIDATNRVAGVGYLLPASTNALSSTSAWDGVVSDMVTVTNVLDAWTNEFIQAVADSASWTNWALTWTNAIEDLPTNNWNTAYGWGNHATNGYLLPAATNSSVTIATNLAVQESTSLGDSAYLRVSGENAMAGNLNGGGNLGTNFTDGLLDGDIVTLGQLKEYTNGTVDAATSRVAGVGYLLPASTNSAIDDATNRVAGVGYLLPASTNALSSTSAWNGAVSDMVTVTNVLDAWTNEFIQAVANSDSWTNWATAWTNALECLPTNDWNTAYGWGSHATNGYLLPASTNGAVIDATNRVAGVGYLLPASTNAAVIDATNRVAGVGYLLPPSTNAAIDDATNRVAGVGYLRMTTNLLCWTYAPSSITNWGPMLAQQGTIKRITSHAYSGGMTASVIIKHWTNDWGRGTVTGTMPVVISSMQSNFSWTVPATTMVGVVWGAGATTQQVVFSVEIEQ